MRVAGIIVLVIFTYVTTSCKKEGLSDYVAYKNDTINNPVGVLEDYGVPSNLNINPYYFMGNNWLMRVVTESEPDIVYYLEQTPNGPYGLQVFLPSSPKDIYFVGFSYSNPNEPYRQIEPEETDFVVYNNDKRLAGRWLTYGNSGRLILAKKGVTLIFTKR